jgi:hypothetical protein
MEEKLKERIEWSQKVIDHPGITNYDPSYVILGNQIAIMETLLDIINRNALTNSDINTTDKKNGFTAY